MKMMRAVRKRKEVENASRIRSVEEIYDSEVETHVGHAFVRDEEVQGEGSEDKGGLVSASRAQTARGRKPSVQGIVRVYYRYLCVVYAMGLVYSWRRRKIEERKKRRRRNKKCTTGDVRHVRDRASSAAPAPAPAEQEQEMDAYETRRSRATAAAVATSATRVGQHCDQTTENSADVNAASSSGKSDEAAHVAIAKFLLGAARSVTIQVRRAVPVACVSVRGGAAFGTRLCTDVAAGIGVGIGTGIGFGIKAAELLVVRFPETIFTGSAGDIASKDASGSGTNGKNSVHTRSRVPDATPLRTSDSFYGGYRVRMSTDATRGVGTNETGASSSSHARYPFAAATHDEQHGDDEETLINHEAEDEKEEELEEEQEEIEKEEASLSYAKLFDERSAFIGNGYDDHRFRQRRDERHQRQWYSSPRMLLSPLPPSPMRSSEPRLFPRTPPIVMPPPPPPPLPSPRLSMSPETFRLAKIHGGLSTGLLASPLRVAVTPPDTRSSCFRVDDVHDSIIVDNLVGGNTSRGFDGRSRIEAEPAISESDNEAIGTSAPPLVSNGSYNFADDIVLAHTHGQEGTTEKKKEEEKGGGFNGNDDNGDDDDVVMVTAASGGDDDIDDDDDDDGYESAESQYSLDEKLLSAGVDTIIQSILAEEGEDTLGHDEAKAGMTNHNEHERDGEATAARQTHAIMNGVSHRAMNGVNGARASTEGGSSTSSDYDYSENRAVTVRDSLTDEVHVDDDVMIGACTPDRQRSKRTKGLGGIADVLQPDSDSDGASSSSSIPSTTAAAVDVVSAMEFAWTKRSP